MPRSWSKPRVPVSEPNSSARLMEQRNAGSAAACFVDLDALKFWDAIAGVIAISILAVIAFADYDRGCAPDVISSNVRTFMPCN